jgi:hypothetical protein
MKSGNTNRYDREKRIMGDGGDWGDPALPPPPPAYVSPSVRRKAARESTRATRRAGLEVPGRVPPRHGSGEAVGNPLKPQLPGELDRQIFSPRRSEKQCRPIGDPADAMEAVKGGKKGSEDAGLNRGGRPGVVATAMNQERRVTARTEGNRLERSRTRPWHAGLLAAAPRGGANKGVSVRDLPARSFLVVSRQSHGQGVKRSSSQAGGRRKMATGMMAMGQRNQGSDRAQRSALMELWTWMTRCIWSSRRKTR